MKTLSRNTILIVIAIVSLGWLGPEISQAQAPQGLPEGFGNLAPTDFVTQVNGLDAQGGLTGQTLIAVRAHAHTLFQEIDLAQTHLDYRTLVGLYELAHPKFEWLYTTPDETTKKQARESLLSRQDDWTGKPYEELRAKFRLMVWLKTSREDRMREVRNWLAAGHTLADMWPEELGMVRQALGEFREIDGGFSAVWEGTLTAPQTGNYTFFISPINPYYHTDGTNGPLLTYNEKRHRDSFDPRKSVTVSVGGQVVISATPENWVSKSAPIALTAGQPVALRMQVDCDFIAKKSLHAVLAWEGPGIAKSLIPQSQLAPPGGEAGEGLKVTYNWQEEDQPQTVSRMVPMIDAMWADGRILLFNDVDLEKQIGEAVWEKGMSTAYLNALEASGDVHAFLGDPNLTEPVVAAVLSASAQRKAFLDMLLARPALLDPLSLAQARDLYQTFRLGNPEKALDVFGLWATRHADLECWMPNNKPFVGFDNEHRGACLWLARRMTQHLPTHAGRLEDEFLVLPNGGCCLPAAYILEACYLGQGKLNEWIAELDARIADEAVTGDRRVNWLLARAHAEEVRLGRQDRYSSDKVRALAGRQWVEAALAAAETAAVKRRVAKELAGRLTAARQYEEARQVLDDEAGGTPDAVVWRAEVDAFEAAGIQEQQDHAELVKQNYAAKLRERRDRANANGDSAAAARYDALLNEVDPRE